MRTRRQVPQAIGASWAGADLAGWRDGRQKIAPRTLWRAPPEERVDRELCALIGLGHPRRASLLRPGGMADRIRRNALGQARRDDRVDPERKFASRSEPGR